MGDRGLEDYAKLVADAQTALSNLLQVGEGLDDPISGVEKVLKLARKAAVELTAMDGSRDLNFIELLTPGAYDAAEDTKKVIEPGIMHRDEPAFVSADGGSGKTMLAQRIMANQSLQKYTIHADGGPSRPMKSFLLTSEDGENQLNKRMSVLEHDADLVRWHTTRKDDDVDENIEIVERIHREVSRAIDLSDLKTVELVLERVLPFNPDIFIIDSLMSLFPGLNLNQAEDALRCVSIQRYILKILGAAGLTLAHPPKGQRAAADSIAGSKQLFNQARIVWGMTVPPEAYDEDDPDEKSAIDYMLLVNLKQNYDETVPTIRYQIESVPNEQIKNRTIGRFKVVKADPRDRNQIFNLSRRPGPPPRELDRCVKWLKETVTEPILSNTLRDNAEQEGFSRSTYNRARSRISFPSKSHPQTRSHWTFPPESDLESVQWEEVKAPSLSF